MYKQASKQTNKLTRTKYSTPISSLPIDLLAVQFLLPPIMGYIVPREFSKKNVVTWWHIVSRQLRLSSFMFGGRYPEEEGVYVYTSWYAWLLSLRPSSTAANDETSSPPPPPPPLYDNFHKDGGLARVPTQDNVPIVIPKRRMIVPVDSVTLQPLNEAERLLGHPAAGSDDDKTKNTTIVYIPPYFKLRIATFLFLIWTTGSILVCSMSVVPCKLIIMLGSLYMQADEETSYFKCSEIGPKSVCQTAIRT